MKNTNKPVAVAFISDDGYVMPTCTAIASMIGSKRKETVYEIHIVCASLSEESQNTFRRFESDTVHIHIICQSAERFAGLHVFQEDSFCVATPAALLKFVLPELLPDYDRVLYMDGDLVVLEDLSELYHTDLGDSYLASVTDSGIMYTSSKYVSSVQRYFNSGVMLLNLQQMRADGLTEVLIQAKKNMKDSSLMDQNVLNCVCDGRTTPLPVRYNLLAVNLLRAQGNWTIDQLNELYGTAYPNEAALFTDGAIVHFSSKDKPWKNDTVPFADEWYRSYFSAPIDHTLTRSHPARIQKDAPKVSVILTEENEQTLASIHSQSLKDIEILSDVAEARGSYVWFADGCVLTDSKALALCSDIADANGLDVLLFEDSGHRKTKYYPTVCSGQDAMIQLSRNDDFYAVPGMMLCRREYLQEQQTVVMEHPCLAEEYFAFRTLICAERVKVLCDPFCRSIEKEEKADAYLNYITHYNTARAILDFLAKQEFCEDVVHGAALYVNHLFRLADSFFCQLNDVQQEKARQEILPLSEAQLLPVLALHKPTMFPSDYLLLMQYRSEIEYLKKEKGERWHELQALKKEKGERWEELQTLKKEKGERWQELQALKKEKAERWQELQNLKKENAALRQELADCRGAKRPLIIRILAKIAAIFKKGA